MNRRGYSPEFILFINIQIFFARAQPQPAGGIRINAKDKPFAGSARRHEIGQRAILPARQAIAQGADPECAVGLFANRPGRLRRRRITRVNDLKTPLANPHQAADIQARPPVAFVIFKTTIHPLSWKIFRRAELRGELFRRQVMAVVGAGRVVNLPEQEFQALAVAQRQPDRQVQGRRAGKPSG